MQNSGGFERFKKHLSRKLTCTYSSKEAEPSTQPCQRQEAQGGCAHLCPGGCFRNMSAGGPGGEGVVGLEGWGKGPSSRLLAPPSPPL